MTSRYRYIGVGVSTRQTGSNMRPYRFTRCPARVHSRLWWSHVSTAASPMARSLGRIEQSTPARPGNLVTAAIGLPFRRDMRLRVLGSRQKEQSEAISAKQAR
ncbi:hypothetical protein ANOM_006389 [Aspergillus nomiae NRRL 13137]|uniref:Uncharacterized protein n=1 Tax=Aspergillus nomiae NRRL (strain ATCC 15546 / NRRL 13137 / CBS 260.88 / M93) TaxID=1509407 RepID=A0A0L1J592_ASPN3|nr:uncharacterized protein ANOM_006389 [Aspergillus nomiae NRRL 13137]KNG86855.1 hypothetical protein ANOM_006389 [Aspergillus nomiae NRRL 13137]